MKTRAVVFGLLAALWAASIFVTSSGFISSGQLARTVSTVAGGNVSESEFRHFWGVAWWIFVKGWHATEFAILYLLARKATPKLSWLPILLVGAYAVSDELHQLFVPWRGCRASDVCIDWLGIATSWALTSASTRRFRQKTWLVCCAGVLLVGLLFLLSVEPFGLIELSHSDASSFKP